VLQPLVTNDPPPTYFKTDNFTSCFQVQPNSHSSLSGRRQRTQASLHQHLLLIHFHQPLVFNPSSLW